MFRPLAPPSAFQPTRNPPAALTNAQLRRPPRLTRVFDLQTLIDEDPENFINFLTASRNFPNHSHAYSLSDPWLLVAGGAVYADPDAIPTANVELLSLDPDNYPVPADLKNLAVLPQATYGAVSDLLTDGRFNKI